MNYELAKQLKGAGFPQRKVEDEDDAYLGLYVNYQKENGFYEKAYAPSLSELIEACGTGFDCLDAPYWEEEGSVWAALGSGSLTSGYGSTPEEAVAKLWLELNSK